MVSRKGSSPTRDFRRNGCCRRDGATSNDKAAKRRPVGWIQCFAERENLERAKGLEPSTPTLARSCSTTELHPHPRWRRSLAVNGRPMPNAGCECNSPRKVRGLWIVRFLYQIGSNQSETTPKRGLSAFVGQHRELRGSPPARDGAIRASSRIDTPDPLQVGSKRPLHAAGGAQGRIEFCGETAI